MRGFEHNQFKAPYEVAYFASRCLAKTSQATKTATAHSHKVKTLGCQSVSRVDDGIHAIAGLALQVEPRCHQDRNSRGCTLAVAYCFYSSFTPGSYFSERSRLAIQSVAIQIENAEGRFPAEECPRIMRVGGALTVSRTEIDSMRPYVLRQKPREYL